MAPWVVALAAGLGLGYTVGAHGYHRWLGRGALRCAPGAAGALAFTFDDGPDPEVTLEVARILEDYGGRGTFFVVARRLARYGWVARELAERGHELGLHGLTHRHLWTLGPAATFQHLRQGVRALQQVGLTPVRFYRPPWGHFNGAVCLAARRLGLQVVLWSAAPPDWRTAVKGGALLRSMVAGLEPGAIVDLHDSGPLQRRGALLRALPEALARAAEGGLRAVTLSELLRRAEHR